MEKRPMVCDCGSHAIQTEMNVGFDIDPEGEENQHLDTCLECGLTRLWVERWTFGDSLQAAMSPSVHWEKKWSKSPYGVDF